MKSTNFPKIIAHYLPQFHEIDENNQFWGNGFTEWTNVKNGKPLYEGHYQPKVPLNKKYYNLLDKLVLDEQAKLARRYGVDGFCFYHYWFNGKLLLEQPVKILLDNKNILLPFCFSWANETWSRRWDGRNNAILIKQNYGEEEEWEKHLEYFMPYFKDERYIKVDNKPILLLYRAFEIPRCEQMIDFWNARLIKEGLSGVYIIETLNGRQFKWTLSNSEAYVEFEPIYTIWKGRRYNVVRRVSRYLINKLEICESIEAARRFVDYDKVWENILKRNHIGGKKCFLGTFPNWDNTARRGNKATVFRGSTPEKFEKYFMEQYKKSIELENEFIFINAWNEWGEGAYLEPDEKYQYQYLEAIRCAKDAIEKEFL